MNDEAMNKIADAVVDDFSALDVPGRLAAVERAAIEAAPHLWDLAVANVYLEGVKVLIFGVLATHLSVVTLASSVRSASHDGYMTDASLYKALLGGFSAIGAAVIWSSKAVNMVFVPEWYAIERLVEIVR